MRHRLQIERVTQLSIIYLNEFLLLKAVTQAMYLIFYVDFFSQSESFLKRTENINKSKNLKTGVWTLINFYLIQYPSVNTYSPCSFRSEALSYDYRQTSSKCNDSTFEDMYSKLDSVRCFKVFVDLEKGMKKSDTSEESFHQSFNVHSHVSF